jgi:hypothetical protein
MLDSVYFIVSATCIVYIFLVNMFLDQVALCNLLFPDMFHIHPSMDECWINEMYMYVCMYHNTGFIPDAFQPQGAIISGKENLICFCDTY